MLFTQQDEQMDIKWEGVVDMFVYIYTPAV